jgi:peptidoglycan L-alanyl-D-glutamate endopeptidase CwlK
VYPDGVFYDARNRAVIETLLPQVQPRATAWLADCERLGIWLLLTEGYRSWLQQAMDYAQGRIRPGKRITNAKPGFSFHQYRVAIDFVPADGKGGLHYEDMLRYTQAAALAKAHGFEWGAEWTRAFRDVPHLQYTGGLTIQDFRNGKRPA